VSGRATSAGHLEPELREEESDGLAPRGRRQYFRLRTSSIAAFSSASSAYINWS
jgi:hypothetical protein